MRAESRDITPAERFAEAQRRAAIPGSVVLAGFMAQRAEQRQLRKVAMGRRFEAAQQSRLTYGWTTTNSAFNSELRMDLDALRARARDLAANNDYARKFLSMVQKNVVGPNGFTFQSLAVKPDNTPDDSDRNAIEAALAEWSQPGECEVTGMLSLADVERVLMKAVARDGEALARAVRDRKFRFGYRLQLLDIDRLDVRYNDTAPNGNRIVMSVEIDAYGRPSAYWLLTRHPGDTQTANATGYADPLRRERIPAAEIFHLFIADRPEQIRGLPWMHTAMQRLQMLAGYEEAAIVAARTGAAKMGFFVSPDGTGTALADGKEAGSDGRFIADAEAGSFEVLPEGYDFKPWSPEYPTQNYDAFVKQCLRGLSSGLDVAYNTLANDLEGVNFSSIRSGTLEDRDQWMVLQGWLIGVFLRRVFGEWLETALLRGAIIDAYGTTLPASRIYKFRSHAWQGRRWDWVDPEKDINAKLLAMRAGLIDPQTIAAQSGLDLEDVIARLQAANKMAKDAGLPPYFEPPPPPPVANPPADPALKKAVDLLKSQAADIRAMAMREPVPAPSITINQGAVEVRAGDTHVAPPAVQIDNHLPPPSVTVENRQDSQAAPAVEVRVEAVMPAQAAPVVEVNVQTPDQIHIASMPTRETSTRIDRNLAGEITNSVQVEKDL